MSFFARLKSLISPASSSEPLTRKSANEAVPEVSVQRAIERLYEDESLVSRLNPDGLLTDAGFTPLFGAIAALGQERASAFSSTDDLSEALRSLARASIALALSSADDAAAQADLIQASSVFAPKAQATEASNAPVPAPPMLDLGEGSSNADERAGRVAEYFREMSQARPEE